MALLADDELAELLDGGRYDDLEQLLANMEDSYGQNPLCEWHIVIAYRKLGLATEPGIASLSKWVKARPTSFRARISLAHALMGTGYTARGTAFASETSSEQMAGMREHFAAAITELDVAESIQPHHMFAVAIRLSIMKAHGRTGLEELANQYLAHDPLNYIVRSRLIKAFEPRWGGSIEDVRRIAESAQQYADRNERLRVLLSYEHGFLGRIADEKKDYELAVQHYTRALEFGDLTSRWTHARARTNSKLHRMAPAMRDINRALELHPNDPASLALRASFFMSSNLNDKALDDLNRSIEIYPDHSWSRRMRGQILQGKRRWADAINDNNVYLSSSPDDSSALMQNGYILLKWLKDSAGAIPYLTRAARVDPEDPFNWFYLGEALKNTGNTDAGETYRRFLSLTDAENPKYAQEIATARGYLDSAPSANTADQAKLPALSLLRSK